MNKYSKSSDSKKRNLPVKQSTFEELPILEETNTYEKKFYFYEMLAVILGFINNIQTYNEKPNFSLPLFLSVSFLLIMAIICILFLKLSKRFPQFVKFSYPLFFLLTGLGIIFTNPEVFKSFGGPEINSACPTILILILKLVLNSPCKHKYSIYIISVCLGLLTFALKIVSRQALTSTLYLLSVLICICMRFGIKCKKKSSVTHLPEEVYKPIETLLDLDYSDLVSHLKLAIKSINQYAEDTQSSILLNSVQNLEKIWLCLKKNQNIYNSNFENVTKYMDDQDRVFIEQSCFIGKENLSKLKRKDSFKVQEQQISYGVTELMGALSQIGKDWNFDTFFIRNCSGNEPLKVMGIYAICRYSLDQVCNTDIQKIEKFLWKLEKSYKKKPYHCSAHGADVMSSFLYLVNNSDMVNHITSTELLSGIIATLSHDVGHPGKTNRFLIMTKDQIAITYNDISVLENLHASILFNILKNEETNILAHFSSDKYFFIRKSVIDMILATDMSKHFDMMAQFRVKYYESDSADLALQDTRNDVFRIMMKASDIGHAAKTVELHEKWCKLVIEEFYEQGDLEKILSIPVSMYCDRETTDVSKSQAGFIRNIVCPLFSSLNSILLSEKIEKSCLNQLRTNELYWVMRRKTMRGHSLIMKTEDYKNVLNSINDTRNSIRKPSLPQKKYKSDET